MLHFKEEVIAENLKGKDLIKKVVGVLKMVIGVL